MEVVMRGIDTPVRKMRREIFKEIAAIEGLLCVSPVLYRD